MKKVINTERFPIKMWLEEIEEEAMKQAKNIANLPFVHSHIALMPDCHQGYGMPIGGVLPSIDVVVPNAVGVDIGCGMSAVQTSLEEIEISELKEIMKGIRERIPLGFKHHRQKQIWKGFDNAPDISVVQQELESARYQLGTLGGGNHFLEIQTGDDGKIWIMIHSGSRNFGLKIAREYHKKAKTLCEKWHSSIPERDLAFLPLETPEASEYIEAMNFALEFAYQNRMLMMRNIKDVFISRSSNVEFSNTINIHHNYARLERHFGRNVMIHRKGATSAREGETGLIPGSQGTASYVVKGLGNRDSFHSCSHGAGRKLGRKQAVRVLNLEEEKGRLDQKGIVHAIRNKGDLEEASGAYKDIDQVMAFQEDLVEIIVKLEPLAVIKG